MSFVRVGEFCTSCKAERVTDVSLSDWSLASVCRARIRMWITKLRMWNILVFLCITLMSCAFQPHSEPTAFPTLSLPDLHQPGVVKLAAISSVQGKSQMKLLATYSAAEPGARDRILFTTSGHLYTIDTDGANLRKVVTACAATSAFFAPTPDGRWLLCHEPVGPARLTGFADTPYSSMRIEIPGHFVGRMAWTTDRRKLAIATTDLGGCAFAVYDVSADFTVLSRTLTLSFPDYQTDEFGCTLSLVGWSADGQTLGFTAGVGSRSLLTLSLSRIVLAQGAQSSDPITMRYSDLVQLAGVGSLPVWSPIENSLVAISPTGRSNVKISAADGQSQTLLTVATGWLCGVMWMPDGRQLVFDYCLPTGTDGPRSPPNALYIYSL